MGATHERHEGLDVVHVRCCKATAVVRHRKGDSKGCSKHLKKNVRKAAEGSDGTTQEKQDIKRQKEERKIQEGPQSPTERGTLMLDHNVRLD